jgi:hypothetical protein
VLVDLPTTHLTATAHCPLQFSNASAHAKRRTGNKVHEQGWSGTLSLHGHQHVLAVHRAPPGPYLYSPLIACANGFRLLPSLGYVIASSTWNIQKQTRIKAPPGQQRAPVHLTTFISTHNLDRVSSHVTTNITTTNDGQGQTRIKNRMYACMQNEIARSSHR